MTATTETTQEEKAYQDGQFDRLRALELPVTPMERFIESLDKADERRREGGVV